MRAAAVISLLAFFASGTIFAGGYLSAKSPTRPQPHTVESDIIFAHANHTDLECFDCHGDVENSNDAEDRNFPSMDVCGDCHDVESEDDCGVCHRDPNDPQAHAHSQPAIVFGHQNHLGRELDCTDCHGAVATSTEAAQTYMPDMRQCFVCHDGSKADDQCSTCHADNITLADIHPAEWRHQHGAKAVLERDWCAQCHRQGEFCLDCHRGDNLTGNIHDLNYLYTHGLDAKNKRIECTRCHDNRSFCNSCHERENRIPMLHSTVAWLTEHGRTARRDPENCASCHDSDDPTCARSGCHRDTDGMRGTDPRFHASSPTLFRSKGPWHDDGGYFCYRCHVDTHSEGAGFCGYCHR